MRSKRNAPTWVAPGPGERESVEITISTPDYNLLPNTSQAKKGAAGCTATPQNNGPYPLGVSVLEDYTISLPQAIEQLETMMAQADSEGDLDSWIECYRRWIDIWPRVYLGGEL